MPIFETKTLTISIDAPYQEVANDLADPATHPEWAHRFFSGPAIRTGAAEVFVQAPMMGGKARYKVEADAERGIFDLFLAREGDEFGPPIPVRLLKERDRRRRSVDANPLPRHSRCRLGKRACLDGGRIGSPEGAA